MEIGMQPMICKCAVNISYDSYCLGSSEQSYISFYNNYNVIIGHGNIKPAQQLSCLFVRGSDI